MPGCRPRGGFRAVPAASASPRAQLRDGRAEMHDRAQVGRERHAPARSRQPALVPARGSRRRSSRSSRSSAALATAARTALRRRQNSSAAQPVGTDVGSHGFVRYCAGKYRMHADSSGHDVSSQPWIVQYPPGCDESHERVPFGLQSAAVVHSSPILRAQPLAPPPPSRSGRRASERARDGFDAGHDGRRLYRERARDATVVGETAEFASRFTVEGTDLVQRRAVRFSSDADRRRRRSGCPLQLIESHGFRRARPRLGPRRPRRVSKPFSRRHDVDVRRRGRCVDRRRWFRKSRAERARTEPA